jgi:hypothetical protein
MDKPDLSAAPVTESYPKEPQLQIIHGLHLSKHCDRSIINRITGNHRYRSDDPRMRDLYQHTLQVSNPVVCLCGFRAQSREEADIFVSLSTQVSCEVPLDSNPVENGITAPGVKRPGRGYD